MRRLSLVMGAVLATGLLTACSEDGEPAASRPSETSTESAKPASAAEVWEAARQRLVDDDTGTLAVSYVDLGARYLLEGSYELSSGATSLTTGSTDPDDHDDSAWITQGASSWVTHHSRELDFGECWLTGETSALEERATTDALAEDGIPYALQVLAEAEVTGFDGADDSRILARASARDVVFAAVPKFFDVLSPRGRDFMVPIEATVLGGDFVGWELEAFDLEAAGKRAGVRIGTANYRALERPGPDITVALSDVGSQVKIEAPAPVSTHPLDDLAGLQTDPRCAPKPT